MHSVSFKGNDMQTMASNVCHTKMFVEWYTKRICCISYQNNKTDILSAINLQKQSCCLSYQDGLFGHTKQDCIMS